MTRMQAAGGPTAPFWLLLLTGPGLAQDPPPAAVAPTHRSIGVPGHLHGVVLPGSEFEAVAGTPTSKIVVRVEAVQPHGTAHRYDLEFVGLEAGSFDLGPFLRRKDRTDNGALPPLPVVIDTILPAGQVEPNTLPSRPAPRLGGYRTALWLAGGAWVVGLLLILFVGRRRRAIAVAAAPPPTLAERLRPLVGDAIAGRLPDARRHELELLLLGFWRHRLGLEQTPARDAIAQLRAHAEAGALLRELERWLHAPPADRAPVDVAALLRPYEHLPAEPVAERRAAEDTVA